MTSITCLLLIALGRSPANQRGSSNNAAKTIQSKSILPPAPIPAEARKIELFEHMMQGTDPPLFTRVNTNYENMCSRDRRKNIKMACLDQWEIVETLLLQNAEFVQIYHKLQKMLKNQPVHGNKYYSKQKEKVLPQQEMLLDEYGRLGAFKQLIATKEKELRPGKYSMRLSRNNMRRPAKMPNLGAWIVETMPEECYSCGEVLPTCLRLWHQNSCAKIIEPLYSEDKQSVIIDVCFNFDHTLAVDFAKCVAEDEWMAFSCVGNNKQQVYLLAWRARQIVEKLKELKNKIREFNAAFTQTELVNCFVNEVIEKKKELQETELEEELKEQQRRKEEELKEQQRRKEEELEPRRRKRKKKKKKKKKRRKEEELEQRPKRRKRRKKQRRYRSVSGSSGSSSSRSDSSDSDSSRRSRSRS